MNWGAFAGGAAEGFNKTYKMLKEEEERELIKEERRQALETKRRERAAAEATIGRAGTEIYDQQVASGIGAGPQSAQARMLDAENASLGPEGYQDATRKTIASGQYAAGAPQEAIPTQLKGRKYVQSEAMSDYARQLAGINPDKAIATDIQARQLKQFERGDKITEAADEAGKNINKIQTLSPDLGLYGLANVAKKSGLAVEFVEGKEDGSPGKILYTNPSTGKKEEITSFAQGQQALGAYVMEQYLGKTMTYMEPKDAVQLMSSRLQMQLARANDERAERGEARADATLRIAQDAAPLKNNLTVAQTNQAIAAAAGEAGRGAYLASGAALNNARVAELNANRTDKEAAKPFIVQYNALPQEQRDGPEGMALLDQAEAAVAMKSGDFSKIKANTPLGRANAMYQQVAKSAADNGQPIPNRAEFFAQAGYAPPQVQEGQKEKVAELVRRGREAEAKALIAQHNRTFPQTPISLPAPSKTRQLIEAIPR